MDDTLEDRLAAVERALTDDDHDLATLAAEGEAANRLGAVEDDLDTLRDRVDELDAATQALRGYVGNIRAVNEDVRERADLALDVAERAEAAATAESPAASGGATDPSPDTEAARGTDPERARDEEPTLELATDENRQRPQAAQSPTADRCPLCDGDAERRHESRPGRDSRPHGTRIRDDQRGRTDGGFLPEDDAEGNETTVLTRIRALL